MKNILFDTFSINLDHSDIFGFLILIPDSKMEKVIDIETHKFTFLGLTFSDIRDDLVCL